MELTAQEKKFIQKRRHIRFKPDSDDIALISVERGEKGEERYVAALVIDESSQGGGLLIDSSYTFALNREVDIQVGKMSPRKCKIVWHRDLGLSGARIGIEYVN